jgi:2-polyprenyl-6-methoxyphenol hydroxylase-like FAD-dependent oxidoreductase
VLDGLEGLQSRAELHFRHDGTFSVTPIGAGQARLCWVGDGTSAPTVEQLDGALRRDPWLRERVSRARWVEPCESSRVASVEARAAGVEGLLLAGDAAAPAEPLLADGLHAAMRGGVLAAEEALTELEEPTGQAHRRLKSRRARELTGPWPIARVGRAIVTSPAALTAAAVGARLAPGVAHRLARRWTAAGDAPGRL